MWARHDVAARTGATVTLHHPQVGEIHLDREKLGISGTDGVMVVIHHPQPGTDSADQLALLASATASPAPTHDTNASARKQ